MTELVEEVLHLLGGHIKEKKVEVKEPVKKEIKEDTEKSKISGTPNGGKSK